MPTNFWILRGKTWVFPLIALLILSCSPAYKTEVEESAGLFVESLIQGDSDFFGQLPEDTEKQLKESMQSVTSWSVEAGDKKSGRVEVVVSLEMEEGKKSFLMFFKETEGQWQALPEISFYQSIDFIPFVGAEAP